jgi:hypothetical protein
MLAERIGHDGIGDGELTSITSPQRAIGDHAG